MESVMEYVKDLYKDDVADFDHEIIDDPTIPQWISDMVYYGMIHSKKYSAFAIPEGVVEEDGRRPVVNYHVLTTYVIKKFCIISFNKIVYIYKDGVFREEKGEVGKLVEKILLAEGIADKRKIRETTNEVMARIYWRTFFREYPFNRFGREFIPLKNGVLWRGPEYRLLPHSPAFGYTYKLPVKYNPNAKCPKIEKFISEIVSPDNIPILYEIPASCLLQSPEYHHAYMLYGEGSNGKTTYLSLLEAFLGKENIANVSLQELCEDKFKAAQLVGKLANIHADIPKRPIKYTGRFKILTGGDRITVERKYKDPFEFRNTARLIFAANEYPEVNDQSYAFWRRWILVEFPNQFPENPELIKELTTEEELSGFLNKVLEALTRIEIKGITKTESVEKSRETWKKKSNSVYAFVVDCIERDPQGWEPKDFVYARYVEYCNEYNLTVRPKNYFAQELIRLVPGIHPTQRKVQGKVIWGWSGLRLIKKETVEDVEDVDYGLDDLDRWFDED